MILTKVLYLIRPHQSQTVHGFKVQIIKAYSKRSNSSKIGTITQEMKLKCGILILICSSKRKCIPMIKKDSIVRKLI